MTFRSSVLGVWRILNIMTENYYLYNAFLFKAYITAVTCIPCIILGYILLPKAVSLLTPLPHLY